ILGEDGLDGVTLRPQAAEVIRRLDERGILNTVCSKNDEALAKTALEKFGLWDYFLYPKINWKPKSGNLLEISKLLNINIDTFAFVDDSAFERAEVGLALGCVRVYADDEAESLLTRPEFDVPVTEDSKKRRAFYMAEARRQDAFTESDSGDYKSFILSCGFVIDVAPCKAQQDLDRCHELLMRTNQLNASTNRIPMDAFLAIAEDSERLILRVKCVDRYGEYGTVGCLILDMSGETLLCTDFVISCRVAKKKVESAVIMYLMQKYGKNMDIVYRPSERNYVLKDEFLSIGADYDEQNALMHFAPDTIRDYDWATVKEGSAQ
ncbi:MAG: HAD-IIIC family phosphatase, partial [Oscillospiraceae bacterium]|nr:HAD-IIIC family phosphatase [Oscillospiraceae bacterium]